MALLATIGFGILGSYTVFPIFADLAAHTYCEILGAMSIIFIGMLMSFFYGAMMADADDEIGFFYVFTSLMMLMNTIGLNAGMAVLMRDTSRPYAVRDRECQQSFR